ncbi:hypothetical protein [Flavobacterium sp. JAS]|uniref:hypothetical protein n=1 Tax=Flavobacterium sp. JAS TaxID=2897329 RepID=UPI001E42246A|nr:hypothetical protein [Flavobacterium sp. JAS]MCD0470543.1 hypothetical protein [Flavobacterium sp. JAS]
MENGNNQNYDRDNRDFNQILDTIIGKENANQDDKYQNHEEFIDDLNHQTNDYNRNENSPNSEPIINGEDQITNDQEPDDFDDDFDQDDLDDEDDEDDDSKKDNSLYIEQDLDQVSHDPFPSLDPGKI